VAIYLPGFKVSTKKISTKRKLLINLALNHPPNQAVLALALVLALVVVAVVVVHLGFLLAVLLV
jgi:hypothetical protein